MARISLLEISDILQTLYWEDIRALIIYNMYLNCYRLNDWLFLGYFYLYMIGNSESKDNHPSCTPSTL